MAESERVLFCSIDHQKRDHLFGMKATGPIKCGKAAPWRKGLGSASDLS